MARRWARLLWCASFCCTAAWAAASPQHGRLLTEQEAGDARAVTQRLQQPADPVAKKMAMQLRKQGERQMQRRNWSAAVKLFGESMVRYPAPEALARYADAELQMLAKVRAREPVTGDTVRDDVRHAVRFYESSLAADSVLKTLASPERSRIERNAACLHAYIRSGDESLVCEPLQWYRAAR